MNICRFTLLLILAIYPMCAFADTYPTSDQAMAACSQYISNWPNAPKNNRRCQPYQADSKFVALANYSDGTIYYGNEFYYTQNSCASLPPLNSGWSSLGNGASCQGGCSYGPATSSETTAFNGRTYFSLAGAAPTGGLCTVGDGSGSTVSADDCTKQGNLTQCIKPDGRQCAKSSSGKEFCWSATEAGTKVSGNEGATKSPVGTNINAPNSKPSNGGDWQQSGQGTSSSTSGGNTTNYNITNWTSSYGSQGNGSGDGSGDGEGDGDGDGDSPGQGMGDFYQKSDKTVASVFADFKGKIGDAPLFKSATAFLGGCSGGGQCPNETWDGGEYAGKFDLSQLCSGALGTLMNFAGFVFLAAMGAVGFRWALL